MTDFMAIFQYLVLADQVLPVSIVSQDKETRWTHNEFQNSYLFVKTFLILNLDIPDTVLFLGKAVLAAILVILLVQFIADQEVCSVNVPLDKLPDGAKKILSGIHQQDSWRCPYGILLTTYLTSIIFSIQIRIMMFLLLLILWH